MRLVTVAGPPSSGKTSVIVQLGRVLDEKGKSMAVVKFDCMTSFDRERYTAENIPVKIGLAGKMCPDHYFACSVEDAIGWGEEIGIDFLVTESAGLCNRCSPHIRSHLGICVIDNLSGVQTPRKIGPLLRFADVVVITKSDLVSQAEREVFRLNVRRANPRAAVRTVNGITGQGSFIMEKHLEMSPELDRTSELKLRFNTPSSVCSYCTGETRIGSAFQMGMIKRSELS